MNAVRHLERRESVRVPYAARVMIVRGDTAWYAQVLDICEGGCGVFRPDGFMLREDDVVRLFFHQESGSTAMIVPARIARVAAAHIGIEYHEPQTVPPSRRAG